MLPIACLIIYRHRAGSPGGQPAEVAWLRANVMPPDQDAWALRLTAKDRYSDRCWCWGERVSDAGEP